MFYFPQIKIWFQNHRYKQKRAKQESFKDPFFYNNNVPYHDMHQNFMFPFKNNNNQIECQNYYCEQYHPVYYDQVAHQRIPGSFESIYNNSHRNLDLFGPIQENYGHLNQNQSFEHNHKLENASNSFYNTSAVEHASINNCEKNITPFKVWMDRNEQFKFSCSY